MNLHPFILCGLLFSLPLLVQSQSFSRQVIGSGGSNSTVGNLQLSYTLGEAFVGSTTSPGLYLNQGFQQVPFNPPSFPVEWLDFVAEQVSGNALLRWTTAQELNNQLFEIERSLDGRMFTQIGTQAAAGFSDQPVHYQFWDRELLSLKQGLVFYRLRQVDYDGGFSFSEIRSLTLDATVHLSASLFPNPAQDQTRLYYAGPLTQPLQCQLRNLHGQLVWAAQVVEREYIIPLDQFPSGTYYLQLNNGQETRTLSLLKQ